MDTNCNDKIAIFENNNTTACVLTEYLKDICPSAEVNTFGDLPAAIDYVDKNAADIFLLNIDELDKDFSSSFCCLPEKLSACKIITLSCAYTTSNVFSLLRKGFSDCLEVPVIKDKLQSSINNVKNGINIREHKDGRVFSVFSGKGGLGKTSVAVNLAIELENVSKEKVAVIDMNFQNGDVNTFLDLNPKFGLSYVVNNLEDKNPDFLYKVMTNYKNTELYVLADPFAQRNITSLSGEQTEKLIKALKKYFSYVIIDLPQNIDIVVDKCFNLSEYIFLISNVNLPSLKHTANCLEIFKNKKIDSDKIKIIINKYIDNEEISTIDIENILKQNVYQKIPNNYMAQLQAMNKGIGISELNSDSNIAKSYKNFAIDIIENLKRG